MKRVLAAALVVVLASTACSRLDPGRAEVRRALAAAGGDGRAVSYVERTRAGTRQVDATIVDDYRYRLELRVDGSPAATEVVVDDARAVRVERASLLPELALPGAMLPNELATGAWVVDPLGAKGLFRPPERRGVAVDPLTQALDVVRYVRDAVDRAPGIEAFNADATTYRKEHDPFPPPAGGQDRFDIVVAGLTPVDPASAAAAGLRPPDARFFRRMALYVRDGVVVQVREHVSVADALRDPRTRLTARLGDYRIQVPDAPVEEQARVVLQAINDLAQRQGGEQVRERDLDVRFGPLPAGAAVTLPEGVAQAALTGIVDHGQVLAGGR